MPFTEDAVAAQQIQERLKSLFQLCHEIEKKRQQSENGMDAILKAQENPEDKSKLKALHKSAIVHAEQEEEQLRKALHQINEIRNIKNERRIQTRHAGNEKTTRRGPLMQMLLNSAQTLPLFVGKIGEKPPPLCGAIPAEPNHIAKVGHMVAALVDLVENDEVVEQWILAEVISYNHTSNKYEVEDIWKVQNQKCTHILNKRRFVPLPLMRANPETDPSALYPIGTFVMALYPQTTCLYKAVVSKVPQTHSDEYEVRFEDPRYPEGYSHPLPMPQRYVIAQRQRTNRRQGQSGSGTSGGAGTSSGGAQS